MLGNPFKVILRAICVLGLSSQVSQANIIFELGNNPQPNEENLLLNKGTTGATVFGQTSQSGFGVAFSSLTDILAEPSSGQARVESLDGLVNSIKVSVPGATFGDLIVNPFKGTGQALLTVVANEPGGGSSTFTFGYALGNGNNFVTILSSGGETIESVKIDSSAGFADLRQPRISDVLRATSVPDGGSCLALLSTSMVALTLIRCRIAG